MDEYEYYTYEIDHEKGRVNVYGWDRHETGFMQGYPRKNFVTSCNDVKEARSNYPGIYDTHPANDVYCDD